LRCLVCESLSFSIICKNCQEDLLKSNFYKREIDKDFFVYSFYTYGEIKELLNCKYEFYGDRVLNILAKLSFEKFASNFDFTNQIYAIPIDDFVKKDFSHSAILVHHLKSKYITPIYNTLHAKHRVKYAGKSLEFRKQNIRDFRYSGEKNIQAILVDDIVTTGLTMKEAKKVLEENGCEVLFALTLSDLGANITH